MDEQIINEEQITAKKYLSISEMAKDLGVSVEVLRKWERDFPRVIHPLRTSGGNRLYDAKQQEKVAMVHRLLHTHGMTIQGAKRVLSNRGNEEETRQEVIQKLLSVKTRLLNIVQELDNLK